MVCDEDFYSRRHIIKNLILILSLFLSVAAFSEPFENIGCDKLLSGSDEVDVGTVHTTIYQREFHSVGRRFAVNQYKLNGAKKWEKNRDKLVRLAYVLYNDKNQVVWSFDEFARHRPTAIVLNPTNSDIAYIAKRVERLYPTESAPPHAIPHRDYPGLSFDAVFEVVRVQFSDGTISIKDIFTSRDSIASLEIFNNRLVVVSKNRRDEIDLNQ